MKLLRNYGEDDVLATILLLYFAFQHGAVGIVLLLMDDEILAIPAFEGMARILPINIWGVIMLISAVLFVLSAIQENKSKYWFMMLSGLAGTIPFSLLAMANIEMAVGHTNTVNYIIIASIDAIVAIIGGVALWLRRGS